MGTRENKVETYLKDRVKKVFNGISRKWVSPGHDGVHDQILFIKNLPVVFVEVKTTDGKLSEVQKREHERLGETGSICYLITVYGHDGVDKLIEMLKQKKDMLCLKNC
jgi:hypothetical protein